MRFLISQLAMRDKWNKKEIINPKDKELRKISIQTKQVEQIAQNKDINLNILYIMINVIGAKMQLKDEDFHL